VTIFVKFVGMLPGFSGGCVTWVRPPWSEPPAAGSIPLQTRRVECCWSAQATAGSPGFSSGFVRFPNSLAWPRGECVKHMPGFNPETLGWGLHFGCSWNGDHLQRIE